MKETSTQELDRLFSAQQEAFAKDRTPSLESRLERLRSLDAAMIAFREPFQKAVSADFANHHPLVTDLFESGAVVARSRFIQAMLSEWMKPSPRKLNTHVHGTSTAWVAKQPKGVVGNIAPWNFPIECALIMVADMLAAGNRVIVKTSELAPNTAEVVREAVAKHLPEDVLAVTCGSTQFAEYFASLPWAHLTYTGSTRVGRLVMQAAAQNLTPVTLELGGKNPVVFAEDGLEDGLIERFLFCRAFKGGQVCTSPDYALVPEQRLDEWLAKAQALWSRMYPKYVGHPEATGAINDRHYQRVLRLVQEAEAAGVKVISLNGDKPDPDLRQIPMYVIVKPPGDLACMQEEIFGPVTPVLTYRSMDEVHDLINAGPAPLAAYIVTRDDRIAGHFAEQVLSGGTGINVFGFQGADATLPFGGVGPSGMGCHSGYEGFLSYSHVKSVFKCEDDNVLMMAIKPPLGDLSKAFADAALAPAG